MRSANFLSIGSAPRLEIHRYEFLDPMDAMRFITAAASKLTLIQPILDDDTYIVEVAALDFVHEDQLEPLKLQILGRERVSA